MLSYMHAMVFIQVFIYLYIQTLVYLLKYSYIFLTHQQGSPLLIFYINFVKDRYKVQGCRPKQDPNYLYIEYTSDLRVPSATGYIAAIFMNESCKLR